MMEDRRTYIGGSDTWRLMKGEWLALYEEKMGISLPPDLSMNFQVQLGVASEPLHKRWVDQFHHALVDRPFRRHDSTPWMAANVDAWIIEKDTFLELKHTRSGQSIWDVTQNYLPQMAHYCMVHERLSGWLSVIFGNSDPVLFEVRPPQQFMKELFEIEQAFWWHLENEVPPDPPAKKILTRAQASMQAVTIDSMRRVDMSQSNEWTVAAMDYIASMAATEKNEQAKAMLKGLVEADVSEAFGHGVFVKRNKKGQLRLTTKEED